MDCQKVSNCFAKFKICVLAFTFPFALITFVLFVSPLILFRWLLTKTQRFLRPDIYKIVDLNSVLCITRDISKDPSFNIILSMEVNGKLNYEEFCNRVSQIITLSNENGGLVYPEFQMYWVNWLGFPFWTKDKDFQITNQISKLTVPADCNEQDWVFELEKKILGEPFKKNRPIWEIVLVERSQSWNILMKFHHALGDGYSILKALTHGSDLHMNISRPKDERSFLQKSWDTIKFPFLASYELAEEKLTPRSQEPAILSITTANDPNKRGERFIVKSPLMDFSKIKEISTISGVGVSTVLFSAISGGIHNFLVKRGNPFPQNSFCNIILPLPIPDEGLCNKFLIAQIKLPLQISAAEGRLSDIEGQLKFAKESTASARNLGLLRLFSSLPDFLRRRVLGLAFSGIRGNTFNTGFFPGPKQEVLFNGEAIREIYYFVKVLPNVGLHITTLSYNGKIRFLVNVNPNIIASESDLKELLEDIQFEITRETTTK